MKEKEIILQILKKYPFQVAIQLRSKYKDLFNKINKISEKLNGRKFTEKCFWFLNNLKDFPQCKNKKFKHQTKNFKNLKEGYGACCVKCIHNQDRDQKLKETCLKKYGVDSYLKTEQFKEKTRQTNLRKYGVEKVNQFLNREDFKNKCLKKYGVDSYLKTEQFKEKTRQTNLRKYGVENFSETKSFKDKVKKTKFEKYGDENFNNILKMSVTCLKKYGVSYFIASQQAKEKSKKTCLKKYGVEHFSKSNLFCQKRNKKYLFENFQFDSADELYFYIFLKLFSENFEYQPNIKLKYIFENKVHFYFPDFKVGNQLIEIKGDQFFKENKMINPYDENQNGLYEAKHQCMLSNNVKILKSSDLKILKNKIDKIYGKNFFKKFKV